MEVDPPVVVPTSPVESVDRALRTLETVASAGPGGVSLADLSASLGVHKTTVHRSLAALRHRDYVSQDPTTGRYSLGPAGVGLADRYFSENDLPARLHGALVAVCSATNELVHLGVLNGVHVVYLDKVEPDRPVRVWSAVGRRNWAATTALGRALLAFGTTPEAALDVYASAVRPAGRITATALATELEAARSRGYATEVQENEPGIACLAVPLLRGGRPVAALSVTAPADRMTPERMTTLHERVVAVATPLLPTGLALHV
ncbi:IclR family transcriptional regulator [Cellulomonas dongxiuzhuiae]|uniref:IclR family transcriptional regulator n=1 Tax=Cellulomonas dongxiuzhuiae TaxID=2819979 RepID=A0ABX8GQE0_9CELL|nr:IclR family transcriptional regulator [Cellulomonas dongxiuzhuiae]MBO3087367.1 IclR family transcriptional regulator [Cellulomonas dongxiuzhuiae]MBO3093236.1 IclR family transcriptional regulator [Cellulomonas dongxiuzhuiae]QWC17524.1 IclR family transcriptional regulator [Cellulomonas dongxiuzhuiae]